MDKKYTYIFLAFLFILSTVAPFIFPNYMVQMTELLILIILALTWNLIGGQMGYNSFGNIAFFGIGMYVTAVLQVGLFYDVGVYNAARGGGAELILSEMQYITGFATGLLLAGFIGALTALFLGLFILGMRGHYFAICTLGLGGMFGEIFAAWEWVGAGSGMTVPNPPASLEDTGSILYYLAFCIMLLTLLAMLYLNKTRFGLSLCAIRDDEDKAESMGIKTVYIKISAWMISAFFVALAGGVAGNLKKFIDPRDTAFTGETYGIWMILMVILGGKGYVWGAVIGAIIFQITKELFWTYLLGWQRVALGLLILIVIIFFPQGIMGTLRDKYPRLFGVYVDDSKK